MKYTSMSSERSAPERRHVQLDVVDRTEQHQLITQLNPPACLPIDTHSRIIRSRFHTDSRNVSSTSIRTVTIAGLTNLLGVCLGIVLHACSTNWSSVILTLGKTVSPCIQMLECSSLEADSGIPEDTAHLRQCHHS